MSQPKPYYYYKEKGSDTYHWETSCSQNQYGKAAGWNRSMTAPSGREQCNQCKAK